MTASSRSIANAAQTHGCEENLRGSMLMLQLGFDAADQRRQGKSDDRHFSQLFGKKSATASLAVANHSSHIWGVVVVIFCAIL